MLEQLHVREGVARVRVHRAQRRLARGEVVGMAGEDALVVALGRLRHHPLRFALADHPADVAAQVDGRLHPAVRVPEEGDVGDPDDRGRRGLLAAAQLGDLGAAGAAVRAAGVAVGDDAVRDLAALGRPARGAARAAEVAVVGMGDDDQDAFDGIGFGHGRRW